MRPVMVPWAISSRRILATCSYGGTAESGSITGVSMPVALAIGKLHHDQRRQNDEGHAASLVAHAPVLRAALTVLPRFVLPRRRSGRRGSRRPRRAPG